MKLSGITAVDLLSSIGNISPSLYMQRFVVYVLELQGSCCGIVYHAVHNEISSVVYTPI